MRKSYINNNIKVKEFDALIKITVEMSKYLYPYIREILKSKEDINENSIIWNDFNKRFIAVSYTHLRAHETSQDLVCRLLLEKKKKK